MIMTNSIRFCIAVLLGFALWRVRKVLLQSSSRDAPDRVVRIEFFIGLFLLACYVYFYHG